MLWTLKCIDCNIPKSTCNYCFSVRSSVQEPLLMSKKYLLLLSSTLWLYYLCSIGESRNARAADIFYFSAICCLLIFCSNDFVFKPHSEQIILFAKNTYFTVVLFSTVYQLLIQNMNYCVSPWMGYGLFSRSGIFNTSHSRNDCAFGWTNKGFMVSFQGRSRWPANLRFQILRQCGIYG